MSAQCWSCFGPLVQVVQFEGDAWELSRSDIEIGDKVGQGNYGDVFRGQLAMTAMSPRIYAHKQEMEFEGRSYLTVAAKMLRRKCIAKYSIIYQGRHDYI